MSGPVERVLAALRKHGHEPKRAGAGWSCRCPAHDDRKPSLSIDAGDDGRALVYCHAGCGVDAVCGAIGLRAAGLFEPDLSRRNGHAPKTRRRGDGDPHAGGRTFPTAALALRELDRRMGARRTTWWAYHDASGTPIGLVARYDGPSGKTIRPVSLNGAGWCIGAMPTPRPLYALPDLLAMPAGSRVYVTEGEKAADAARAVGLPATTSPHGSSSSAKADWSPVAGREVVILPDHDDAGERYADDVARLATAAGAKSVRVVRLVERWPDLPEGGDVADLVERKGGDADALTELGRAIEALAEEAEPVTPKPAPIDGAPVIVPLSDVRPELVAWLWPGRIALGKLTLIAGDPGLGKSFLTLDMASRVSTGAGWPDCRGESFPPGGVVLLSAEDGVADTIRPRLDAAGADVARIVALDAIRSVGDNGRESARTFDLSRDLPALEAAIRSVERCRLVVIDPVTAYLGSADSHKNAEIRGLLAPLGSIAERHRVAVVAVTHLNKSGGGPAIYRAMGSLAFAAAARAAWAVTRDRDDPRRRLLLPIKNNVAPDTGGLAYRIEPLGVGGCPAVAWEPDPVNVSADDALAGDRDEGGGALSEAADWLRDMLSDGPQPAAEVKARAKNDGIAARTLDRAKGSLGVRADRQGFAADGRWTWALPQSAPSSPSPTMAHNGVSGALCDFEAAKGVDDPSNGDQSPIVRQGEGHGDDGDGPGGGVGPPAPPSGSGDSPAASEATWADGSPIPTDTPPNLAGGDPDAGDPPPPRPPAYALPGEPPVPDDPFPSGWAPDDAPPSRPRRGKLASEPSARSGPLANGAAPGLPPGPT